MRFWVWNRTRALSAAEVDDLHQLGVTALYWQLGQLQFANQDWNWVNRIAPPQNSPLRVIPVLRLDTRDRQSFSALGLERLLERLRQLPVHVCSAEMQLDYDCPDRPLPDYSSALATIRSVLPKLSTTALAHWINHPAFGKLAQESDEIVPMFYDLEPDTRDEKGTPQPRPLIDSAATLSAIERWRSLAKPWRAGLPNFSRLTIYDSRGQSRGHIRSWSWNDVCFNPALRLMASRADGVVLLRAANACSVSGTPLATDEWVAVRQPAPGELAEVSRAVRNTNAAGIVYFRLPEPGDVSGLSLRQLSNLVVTTPQLALHRKTNCFELTNQSDADVLPHFGVATRGCALEIDAPGVVWREALAGDFYRVGSHVDAESSPRPVPIALAKRLTFWFSHLPAGETLRTGLVELAPNAPPEQLRYRVLFAGQDAEQWRAIDLAK